MSRELLINDAHERIEYYFSEDNDGLDLQIENLGKIVANGPKSRRGRGTFDAFKAD